DRHLRVVPRHHHLHPRLQLHRPRHIRRPQVKLRPILLDKRRMPAPLLLRQHVHPALKLRVRRNALGLRHLHPPLLLVPGSSSTFPTHALSPAIAFKADPRITGTSSPGNSYLLSSSRTSSSTRSNSSASSTRSHLFRNTTIAGTFTCRASKMCSRVCGIGPSTAETTKIAPSICAAPVIMFFT